MTVPCSCAKFTPIELKREAIDQRIKESPSIKKRLKPLAKIDSQRLSLYQCPQCGQLWQSGHEWNFGDKDYLFHVPGIEASDWVQEPYAQPAAMMIYSAMMETFMSQNSFTPTSRQCKSNGCNEHAIDKSVLCKAHHIESLQKFHMLPQPPSGRIFPPYHHGREP